jgi:hypothetical protein
MKAHLVQQSFAADHHSWPIHCAPCRKHLCLCALQPPLPPQSSSKLAEGSNLGKKNVIITWAQIIDLFAHLYIMGFSVVWSTFATRGPFGSMNLHRALARKLVTAACKCSWVEHHMEWLRDSRRHRSPWQALSRRRSPDTPEPLHQV